MDLLCGWSFFIVSYTPRAPPLRLHKTKQISLSCSRRVRACVCVYCVSLVHWFVCSIFLWRTTRVPPSPWPILSWPKMKWNQHCPETYKIIIMMKKMPPPPVWLSWKFAWATQCSGPTTDWHIQMYYSSEQLSLVNQWTTAASGEWVKCVAQTVTTATVADNDDIHVRRSESDRPFCIFISTKIIFYHLSSVGAGCVCVLHLSHTHTHTQHVCKSWRTWALS